MNTLNDIEPVLHTVLPLHNNPPILVTSTLRISIQINNTTNPKLINSSTTIHT